MELRQLRYFLAAMRLGSVKAAARENFVTAPAVSIQLKHLEAELQTQLFVKEPRGLKPTQAGVLVLTRAEEILARVAALQHAVARLQNSETGFLRVGSIDAASVYVLPKPFRAFRKAHPGVEITVMVADSKQLLDALLADKIEIAIVTLPIAEADLQALPIFDDPMVAVAHPRHALCRRRGLPLSALADNTLITYPNGSTTRQLIDQVFIEHGCRLRPAMELASPEAMKCLTEAGLGACILPWRAVAHDVKRGGLKVLSTAGARFSRTLGVVCKDVRLLSAPGRVFLGLLKSV